MKYDAKEILESITACLMLAVIIFYCILVGILGYQLYCENTSKTEQNQVETELGDMEKVTTEKSETEENAEYTVYVYDSDGKIARQYNNVFDVSTLKNGVVKLSMDEKGKDIRYLAEDSIEIVRGKAK